ncbi:MAG: nucleoside phosphorylase [Candidatus Nomurabacteria bacterium]|nr:nucleoside phosphorylase [Candidatus Nomurabacteria bacterium]
MIKFDSDKQAIFDPNSLDFGESFEKAVMVFDDEVWEDYVVPNKKLSSFEVKNIYGRVFDTFRVINVSGENILLVYPDMGGAASAMCLESLIASGVQKVVAFGTCGAMDKDIAKNTVIVPTTAFREEGLSYHYLPPSDEVAQNEKSIAAIKVALLDNGVDFIEGKIWTTDAVYRETRGKLQSMKKAGGVAVDMELASLLAVAEFRGIRFAEFFIVQDNIDGKNPHQKPRNSESFINISVDVLRGLAR